MGETKNSEDLVHVDEKVTDVARKVIQSQVMLKSVHALSCGKHELMSADSYLSENHVFAFCGAFWLET